jgi:Domain of unknown function (DUF4383)
MNARNFAMVLGVVFIVVGILGFVPGITRMHDIDDPNLTVEGPGHGHLLGLFHVNVLHNLVHIVFGVLGIFMARGGKARDYCRFVAIAYGLLAILGLIPAMKLQYTFGLIPIEGHDVWLHALIAIAAAYFGWAAPSERAPAATAMP